MDLSRAQVLALRAGGHGLDRRRPRTGLVAAAGAVGLRRTRHTDLALAARLDRVEAGEVAGALAREELVAVFGPRGAIFVVPAADAGVFTAGAAPAGEASLRAAVPGAYLRRLDAAGVTVTDALDQVTDAVRRALDDGPRFRGDTAMAVTGMVPEVLRPPCRGRCPDPHVEDSLFRLAGVRGAMRFAGDTDDLVAMAGDVDADAARQELVRRYLRCYGPSTPASFAEWAGNSTADARRSLAGAEAVTVDGAPAGVMGAVTRTAAVAGVRLLPAYDPWLLSRDRAWLVPDKAARQAVWRAAGGPGVVLAGGAPAGTWRTATRRGRVTVKVERFAGGPAVDPDALGDEAGRVGAVIGATEPVEVEVG